MNVGVYFQPVSPVLSKKFIVEAHQLMHLFDEKQLLLSVQSPFIVRLFSTHKDKSYIYFAMEYCTGGEVFTVFADSLPWPDFVAKFYIAELTLALEYLHMLDIEHRDLKLENLLLTGSGHLKLTDFGFAKKINGRTWTVCGTTEYMAPEILQQRGYGISADYWALGVLIYELINGETPFVADDDMQAINNIMQCPDSLQFSDVFTEEVENLVSSLLNPDLSSRLGVLSGGTNDIKCHSFFSDVDWVKLYNGEYKAPITPKDSGQGGTDNFEIEEFTPSQLPQGPKELYIFEFSGF